MSAVAWAYPPEILVAIASLGVVPTPETPPRLVREYLSGLYKFEIRRLRDRHRAGEVSKPDYIPHVIELRKKYWMLTLEPRTWEEICRS